MTTFTLPIPIAAPYSTITYEFFTEGGDINFTLLFIDSQTNEEQIIHETKRVISDEENIYSCCQIDCPGTLIFVWDNTYSWFNNKLLTYAVEIQQDDIESCKRPRVTESKEMIEKLSTRSYEIKSQVSHVNEEISTLSTEISELEETIWKLKRQLAYKKKYLRSYNHEKRELGTSLEQCAAITPALCIRTLNNFELASVLQYLEISTVSMVCKYWYDICHCEYVEGREAPETDYVPVPALYILPHLPAPTQHLTAYDQHAPLTHAHHHSLPTEIIVPSPIRTEEAAAGGAPGGVSFSEQAKNPSSGVGVVKPSVEDGNISSLSDDNHIGRSLTVLKKQNKIEKYFEEIKQHQGGAEEKRSDHRQEEAEEARATINKNLLIIQQLENEKIEIKEKIFQWKKHFEKKFHRVASDEEKVRNIPGLFQRYSTLNRRIIAEQKKLTELLTTLGIVSDNGNNEGNGEEVGEGKVEGKGEGEGEGGEVKTEVNGDKKKQKKEKSNNLQGQEKEEDRDGNEEEEEEEEEDEASDVE